MERTQDRVSKSKPAKSAKGKDKTKSKSKTKSKKPAAAAAEPPVEAEETAAPQENGSLEPTNGEAAADKKDRKSRISFEGFMPADEAVAYFEAIVKGLKKGSVEFKQGEDSLALSPPAYLTVGVKASRKGSRAKISFEMSWRNGGTTDLTVG
jgi:amphi-Trp domain-containing protein